MRNAVGEPDVALIRKASGALAFTPALVLVFTSQPEAQLDWLLTSQPSEALITFVPAVFGVDWARLSEVSRDRARIDATGNLLEGHGQRKLVLRLAVVARGA